MRSLKFGKKVKKMKSVSHWGMHPESHNPDHNIGPHGIPVGVDPEFDEDHEDVIETLCGPAGWVIE